MRDRRHSVCTQYEPTSHANNSDPGMSVMRMSPS